MRKIPAQVASRLVLEAVLTYEADWKAIEAGTLSMPWDMVPGHRQSTPFYAGLQTARFVREAVKTLGRRAVEATPEVWLDESSHGYPSYYLNDFHYQTDGWLSAESADVYETSTETLFLGRQDAMQRATLVPLDGTRPKRILEVACGTGRFATFARDRFPDAELTAVDLSPFYLRKARDNDAYWRDRQGTTRPPATFVQANAETLPFDDASFDAVLCVYLFHELPADARANVAKEMARVAKPGATVVLTDSLQRGDRPALDDRIDNFSKLNEPHYSDYVRTNLPALFEGLIPGEKIVASTSKTLSFQKPSESGSRD